MPGTTPEETEANPLHLDVAPAGVASGGGQIELHSAVAHVVSGESGRRTTLQYWNLSLNGGNLNGTLINAHEAEAATFNFVNATAFVGPNLPTVLPLVIRQGATLTGTITNAQIRLRLERTLAAAFNGAQAFTADIVA